MVVLRLRCRHVDWDLLDANGCRFALCGGKSDARTLRGVPHCPL